MNFYINDDMRKAIESSIATLNNNQQHCIHLRFEKNMTYKNIGKTIGISQTRARQICLKACEKMANSLPLKIYKGL